MKCLRQWIAESTTNMPSRKDYERLLQRRQGREERKGVWYMPFAKTDSGVLCFTVSLRTVDGKLTLHIGSHFYECKNVNGRFAADIYGIKTLDATVLRPGSESLAFLDSLLALAVKTKDLDKIAKAVKEGSLKASIEWHNKNDI